MFSLLVSQSEAKSELPGLTLTQEASYSRWRGMGVREKVRSQTLPRCASGDTSYARSVLRLGQAQQKILKVKFVITITFLI
jgi:hypothetical protein